MKVIHFSDLILQKALADLRSEAARGYLGVIWWVIEPLIYMAVFYIIFTNFFVRGDENYIIFLIVGLVIWKWFAASLVLGANSLMSNIGLINQIYLPKIIFPLISIVIGILRFFLVFLILIIFLLIMGVKPTLIWGYLFILLPLNSLLIIGCASFLASIIPFFPDIRNVLDNIIMLLFFLSGIFFKLDSLPANVQNYISFNPVALIIESVRDVMILNQKPDFNNLLYVFFFSILLLSISIFILKKYDRVYPKVIY